MKKEKNDYSSFYIVGIVIVIAVVAMVIQFGGKVAHVDTYAYEENAAGLAVKSIATKDSKLVPSQLLTSSCIILIQPTDWVGEPEEAESFLIADANGDGVTTGVEYCSSQGLTCVFGIRPMKVSSDIGLEYLSDMIGCGGGGSAQNNTLLANEPFWSGTHYLCC